MTTIQYIASNSVSGWDGLAGALAVGVDIVGALKAVEKDIENSADAAGYDALSPDLTALHEALENAPDYIKSNPSFAGIVKKITDVVNTTCQNYQVVDANGTVGGFLNDFTATFGSADITDTYASYPGVNFTPLIDDAAQYIDADSPPYTGTYTVVNSKTGRTQTFQITVAYDGSSGGTLIEKIVIVSPAAGQTLQQAIDSGSASVQQVAGSNGSKDLQDFINNNL